MILLRLWSIHPKYLDWKGLGAEWREALLAQAVLAGKTKGWKNHPQLERFKVHNYPVAAIGFYLLKVYEEANDRGYNYNLSKIINPLRKVEQIRITNGQLRYEFDILMERLEKRAPDKHLELKASVDSQHPEPHPIFSVIHGDVEPWETGYWSSRIA